MRPSRIMVNGREVALPGSEATAEQIKQAAGIDPNSMLVQQDQDGNQLIQPGQRVKIAPGQHFADVPVFEYGAPVRQIVMTQPAYDALRGHLFSDLSREQHAFLLATPSAGEDRFRLLVREVVPSRAADLQAQSGAYLQVDRAHTIEILQRCYEEGLSLIEAHSHPFCSTGVSFSAMDTGNEQSKFPYVAQRIPDIHHATMVFGTESVDAHIWDRRQGRVLPVDHLRVVGFPLQTHLTTSGRYGNGKRSLPGLGAWPTGKQAGQIGDSDPRAHRQVLAFGREGQQSIASCRVGLAGLGGLGALVAQMLAHLGCREMVLIDDDWVEESNLNRLVGARSCDARARRAKVTVAKRMARTIAPEIQIRSLACNLRDPEAHEALKSCDVIFGGLDNHGARLLLNDLAVRYLIPLIDMGTGIRVNEDAPLQAGGQVRVVVPGGFCLECIGGIDKARAAYDLMSEEARERQRQRGYVDGWDVPAPAVIFLNSMVASLAVQEFVNLLCGFKPEHRLIHWDAMAATAQPLAGGVRRDDCVVCGAGQAMALGDLGSAQVTPRPQETPTVLCREDCAAQ